MVNQQVLEGNWNEIKGKLRSRWGQLTNDELQEHEGNAEQLVGMIQRKTGEARETIESYLKELTHGSIFSAIKGAAENVQEYVHDVGENVSNYVSNAGDSAKDAAKHAADQVRAGYDKAERIVRRNPAESLAVCFGAGLISGIVVGLLLRSK